MGAVQSLSKDDIKRSNDIHFGFFGLDGLPFTKLAGNGDNPTHEMRRLTFCNCNVPK